MIERQALIQSGDLERYLLGDLSKEENSQIELAIANDKELATYVRQLEDDFEQMAIQNAIAPNPQIKTALMSQVKALQTSTTTPVIYLKKWLGIAASAAAFFFLTSIWQFSKVSTLESRIVEEARKTENFSKDFNSLTTFFETNTQWYDAIRDPNAEKFRLTGNNLAPNLQAVSYINHKAQSVILQASNLPELAATEDYQLWADVDGEMIDMGVILKNEPMLAMKYIPNATSLNITIEPLGGNDHPTVERLVSNVYL
ncbi:MAG: anti-sigma-K factor RskA [Dokdonia sp.]|jgi:anti-sigma-K factor RskA